MFQSSEKVQIRRCVLTSQNSIFYRIIEQQKEVEIIVIFDNRQNPDKLEDLF